MMQYKFGSKEINVFVRKDNDFEYILKTFASESPFAYYMLKTKRDSGVYNYYTIEFTAIDDTQTIYVVAFCEDVALETCICEIDLDNEEWSLLKKYVDESSSNSGDCFKLSLTDEETDRFLTMLITLMYI